MIERWITSWRKPALWGEHFKNKHLEVFPLFSDFCDGKWYNSTSYNNAYCVNFKNLETENLNLF